MDFRARDTTWLAQLDELSSNGGLVVPDTDQTLRERIASFKALIKRRCRTWWNHAFLTKYIEKSLIPRGLRIQIFPSFKIEDDLFKTNWESLANNCSLGFLGLLREQSEKSLRELESEIDVLQVQLKKDLSSDDLKKLQEEIDADCQKLVKEIQAMKIKKFQRDTLDMSTHRVYRWRSPVENLRSRSRNNSFTRSRSTSIASGTSSEGQVPVVGADSQGGSVTRPTGSVQTRPNNRRKRTVPFQTRGY
ncbi:uncharacterized protein [Phyllobates terribilis]